MEKKHTYHGIIALGLERGFKLPELLVENIEC